MAMTVWTLNSVDYYHHMAKDHAAEMASGISRTAILYASDTVRTIPILGELPMILPDDVKARLGEVGITEIHTWKELKEIQAAAEKWANEPLDEKLRKRWEKVGLAHVKTWGDVQALDAETRKAKKVTWVIKAEEKARDKKVKGVLDYYDNGANSEEAVGLWWTPNDPVTKDGKPYKRDLTRDIATGQTVDPKVFRDLANGIHPITGEQCIKGTAKKKNADGTEQEFARKKGYDLHVSAPKSFSGAWAMLYAAKDPRAELLTKAHDRANEKALRIAIQQMGLIYVRNGHAGQGETEIPAEIPVARFRHHTSRAGDPQIHTHNVILNIAVRGSDGAIRSIDNKKLMQLKGALAALYRAELAKELKEALGVAVVRDDRNFRIAGFPEDLEMQFSKRRKRILEIMDEQGYDGTEKHRDAAQNANFVSRTKKEDLPPLSVLADSWKKQAADLGHDLDSVFNSMKAAWQKQEIEANEAWEAKKQEAAERGETIEGDRPPYDLKALTESVFTKLTQHNMTFDEKILSREVYEALQVHVGADEAMRVLEEITRSDELIIIPGTESDPVYTTRTMQNMEREMLLTARAMKGAVEPFDKDYVEGIIALGRPGADGKMYPLRDEQAEGVRHALIRGDQIVLIEGKAGAGKSFMSGAIKDALERKGFDVYGIAPSHKAKEVLRDDTQLREELTAAVAGFLAGYDKGTIKPNAKSAILIDECGMIGSHEMARLVQVAKATGCRLIALGDTKQLQPVAAGAPMAALAKVLGSHVLKDIERQQIKWQRPLSVKLASGDAKLATEALEEYAKFGHIKLRQDGETARKELVESFFRQADKYKHDPKWTQLIIAPTNAACTYVNDYVREEKRRRGELTGPEVMLESVTRGRNGRVTDRGFANGDRIIIGETVKFKDFQIANNSTGTLVSIKKQPGEEAVLHIRWDNGLETITKESELIGYREKGSNLKYPKLSHSYCVTVHASQGSTVSACYIYGGGAGNDGDGGAMGLEAAYVAMTRHKWVMEMYVDESRLCDQIAAEKGQDFKITKGKGKKAALPENDAGDDVVVTEKEIKARLFKELSKSEAKKNISDFHRSIEEFLARGEDSPHHSKEATPQIAIEAAPEAIVSDRKVDGEKEEVVMGDTDNRKPGPLGSLLRRSGLRPAAPIVVPAQPAANALKGEAGPAPVDTAPVPGSLRATAMASMAAKPATTEAQKEVYGRIQQRMKNPGEVPTIQRATPDEVNYYVRYDLHDYFTKKRGMFDKPGAYPKGNSSLRDDGVLEFTLKDGKQTVVVSKMPNGMWFWYNRHSKAKGTILDYVKEQEGGNYGRAIRSLRQDLRWDPATASGSSIGSTAGNGQRIEKSFREQVEDRAARDFDQTKKASIQYLWDGLKEGFSSYLRDRGITSDTQTRFGSFIRNGCSWDSQRGRNVGFAMQSLSGEVVGIISKGPKSKITDERDFSMNAKGSQSALAIMGETANPHIIYIGENPIDCMSVFQKEGSPEGAMIASFAGQTTKGGLADLYTLAKKHPTAEIRVAVDNDEPGQRYFEDIEKHVKEARGDLSLMVDARPNPNYKDWNDEIRSKMWTPTEADDIRAQDDAWKRHNARKADKPMPDTRMERGSDDKADPFERPSRPRRRGLSPYMPQS
ncbi:hypothetical protein BB934_45065 (plasmid) [Microvirga ossetica]|uniref:TrwC relaxase domain-containing protein n=1 Tax=Microvirga ossetica TaxID=1882682 RepID=A0A1B2EZY4_9HYPH|nr:MobF family relaxase [Microvirga ossetica]ANY85550.1 hypothetical protein BB934_45065 [Microvirga ossetica]